MAAPTAEQIEAELAGAEAELGAGPAGAAAQADAKAEAEGDAATDEPTGAGDVVPDTASGEGGPAEGQTPEGRELQWIFSEIEPASFAWHSQELVDEKWRIRERMAVRRR